MYVHIANVIELRYSANMEVQAAEFFEFMNISFHIAYVDLMRCGLKTIYLLSSKRSPDCRIFFLFVYMKLKESVATK